MKYSPRTNSRSRKFTAPKPVTVQKPRGPKPIPKAGPLYPMRINKYLAQKGYSTRRGADELIEKRWVTINGKLAQLGDKVNEGDAVEVHNNKKAESYKYYAYYKSKGVPMERVPAPPELSPILGLDAQAEGLVLFSNDRRLIERLSNTKHAHQKEYFIQTLNPLRSNFKEKMEQGVVLNGADPIRTHVSIKSEKSFVLKTTDNGSHIRQMCSLFNAEIASLLRTKILNLELLGLQSEQNREIEADELAVFLKELGL